MVKDLRELKIDETNEMWGVDAISIVNSPAIQENFVALNNQMGLTVALQDTERRLLIGPALIPNKEILRRDEKGNDFYIWFSEDTVEKAAHLYLKRHHQHDTTLEHEHTVRDVYLAESWIKESDLDKSMKFGYRDLPIGTWFVALKVDNNALWDEKVKNGEVKGFSIEGMFTDLASQELKKVAPKVELTFEEKIKQEFIKNYK